VNRVKSLGGRAAIYARETIVSESRFSAGVPYCFPDDIASIAMNSAVRRVARLAQYVPEVRLRTEGKVLG
jgi:hypothetical protein